MRHHRMSLRMLTRQGQTTPQDAVEAAQAFKLRFCGQLFGKIAYRFLLQIKQYFPKRTITAKSPKPVWVQCTNKDKPRATAILLDDSSGNEFDPFILFKSSPAV
ncbi:hypothetical protein PHMEG_00035586 [Phytophthora megakarya]|uniref:Uncharacterized protein n=1 Tax=Phytophthora megakarya TaxID=4795 RepID=A0A225UNR5_9STRA|nr:hypothetical protein PHMEG_00035586 [Phytophthora megakarya]